MKKGDAHAVDALAQYFLIQEVLRCGLGAEIHDRLIDRGVDAKIDHDAAAFLRAAEQIDMIAALNARQMPERARED